MVPETPPGFVDLYTASTRLNVDMHVMGVVTDFLPPVQSRGRDMMSTFSLADHTSGYGDGQKVKYFRLKASELPDIRGTGDVVMLWNIKVKTWSGMNSILSGVSSTWAVFHQSSIPESPSSNHQRLAPVKEKKAPEPKPAEVKYAIALCNSRDRSSYTEPVVQVPISDSAGASGTTAVRVGFKDKFSLIKDLVIDKYFDLTGQVVKIYPSQGWTELYITDYTENTLLYNYEWGRQGEARASRDGDEYGYAPARAKKQWPGPFGKRTLTVTLFPPHSYWAQTNIRESDFVFLRNTHIKYSKDSKMEGVLHTDRRYEDRIDVSKLSCRDDVDDRVKDVLRRKRDYAKQFQEESKNFIEDVRGQKRSGDDSEPLSKQEAKKKRKKDRKAARQGKDRPDLNGGDSADEGLKSISVIRAARNELNKNSMCFSCCRLLREDHQCLQPLVACSHQHIPPRPVSSILDTSKTHAHTSPDGMEIILPFQNICCRATVRVIDFFPPNLTDFAVREKLSEFEALSDHEDEDEEDDENGDSDSSDDMSVVSLSVPSDAGSEITRQKKYKWAWRFCLLVQDVNPGPEKGNMKIIVADGDAEFLLNMQAKK